MSSRMAAETGDYFSNYCFWTPGKKKKHLHAGCVISGNNVSLVLKIY